MMLERKTMELERSTVMELERLKTTAATMIDWDREGPEAEAEQCSAVQGAITSRS